MAHKTLNDIKAHKNRPAPLVCLTAYSAPMAAAIDPYVDLILVGDSVGMVLHGMDSTQHVTMPMMVSHAMAVMRAAPKSCVVVDMPYGHYEHDVSYAMKCAQLLFEKSKCQAVKLEGGRSIAATIKVFVEHDMPVMGHIGLMPQAVSDGKFRVKGKTKQERQTILDDAKAVQEAGAFAVVVEGVIEDIATEITALLDIPTIGIGASAACDGQILVTEDMLGLLDGHTPKFVKRYADLRPAIESAVERYADEVRSRAFPGEAQLYHAPTQSAHPEKKSA